ncbi:MAG: DUF2924 domain-containing protein [Planctomycetota bacterium]|nr:DUF2924 domain-containing protein [Planctomycetota bacterium]
MQFDVEREVAALERMTVGQLRERFGEVFGEQTNARHKQWLIKRIAWKMQANIEGDISERARRRAAELSKDVDMRTSAPKQRVAVATPSNGTATATIQMDADERLPPSGTTLVRPYKGQSIQVRVLSNGFEFEGTIYKSLTTLFCPL